LVFWGCINELGISTKAFPCIYILGQPPPRENQYKRSAGSHTFNISTVNKNFLHFWYIREKFYLAWKRQREEKQDSSKGFFVFSIDSETWLIEFCMSSRRLTGGFPLVTLARPPRDLFLNI
jgi:hypothetical protein